MALSSYLAKNYLSADPKPTKDKKRKRKHAQQTEGVTIADDDVNDWTNPQKNASDDEDAPTIVGGTALSGGLNKPVKKAKWIKVGSTAPSNTEQAAADAILADVAAETSARAREDDDAPAVVGEDGEEVADGGPTMASGAAAGLQSADAVGKALRRKQKAEMKAMKDAGLDPEGKAQETIYRDASGRIINVAMKRAELRAKAEEEERKKAEAAEAAKGDVQRAEKEERRAALENAKVMGVARFADDEEMNEELKGRGRWNDPMAGMVGSKSKSGKTGAKGRVGGKEYLGASEPNRYGIKPGWKWDGVDRGNGFERKWFQARAKANDRRDLEYAWQMDE